MLHSTSEFQDDCSKASSLHDGDGNRRVTIGHNSVSVTGILTKEGDVPAMYGRHDLRVDKVSEKSGHTHEITRLFFQWRKSSLFPLQIIMVKGRNCPCY